MILFKIYFSTPGLQGKEGPPGEDGEPGYVEALYVIRGNNRMQNSQTIAHCFFNFAHSFQDLNFK